MLKSSIGKILALAAVLGIIAAPTFAADAKPTFGKVDISKIYQSYKKVETSNQQIRDFAKSLEAKLDLRNANRLLTEQEMTELQNLKDKQNPTDADKNRTKELEDLAKQRDAQLRELAAKQTPTDQEKAALKDLQDRSSVADKSLATLAKDFEKQAEEKRVTLSKQVNEDILAAVKATAEAQGLSFVVDEQAVLYGGVDITDKVVENLNKK